MFSFHSFHFLLFEGKTNHGQTLYGCATRHKDVSLCSVGALPLYLMFRFSGTCEFENFTLGDWIENNKWFDIKLLVDLQGYDKTKSLQNRSYTEAVKWVLDYLRISGFKASAPLKELGGKTVGDAGGGDPVD
jgi:hypothetical protein